MAEIKSFVFCKYCYYRNAPYAFNGAGCPFENLKITREDYDGCTFGQEVAKRKRELRAKNEM